MPILVPVRYPLTEEGRRTIERGLELAEERPDQHLIVLHVNLLQRSGDVTRADLRRDVRQSFGDVDADYRVREGAILEEAILDEAARIDADAVVVGEDEGNRLVELLERLFGADADLDRVLREELDASVEVVD